MAVLTYYQWSQLYRPGRTSYGRSRPDQSLMALVAGDVAEVFTGRNSRGNFRLEVIAYLGGYAILFVVCNLHHIRFPCVDEISD